MYKLVISHLFLLIVCLATILLALPTINFNVDKPNLIPYFNNDEGGFMDLIWYYYSGEKRKSSTWDIDYGLEMLYIADFSRLVLSRFIKLTPGMLVRILRWLHLIAWVGSLLVFWALVKCHFKGVLKGSLAVLLLAARPSFSYLQTNSKPEPLVLLLMLIGLNYTLKVVEEPRIYRNLFIATACAALAVLVKYAGIFLILPIISSMFFAKWYRQITKSHEPFFLNIKISWILPALAGLAIIVIPLSSIFFYVSKSIGSTWYEEFGLLGSIFRSRLLLYTCVAGIILIFLSPLILIIGRIKNRYLKKAISGINELNSHTLIVLSIFSGFIILFGFRWVLDPRHFINSYAQMGYAASVSSNIMFNDMMNGKGLTHFFLYNMARRIAAIDPIIFLLFIYYVIAQYFAIRRKTEKDIGMLYKRFILVIFITPPLLLMMFSTWRMAEHNFLPFFAAMSILSIEGPYVFSSAFEKKRIVNIASTAVIAVILIIDVSFNTVKLIKSRLYHFRQPEDIAYEIGDWWRKNLPLDTKIVADHYRRAFIPLAYNNVKTTTWNENKVAHALSELIRAYKPEIVYYNANLESGQGEPMPPLALVLPDMKAELIKDFENKPGRYARWPGARFVIYRIYYEED